MQPLPLTLDRSSNLGDLTAPGKTRPCNKINNLPKQDNSVQIIPLWSQMSKEWRQAYNNATRAAKIKRYITWKVRDLKHLITKIKKLFTPGLLKQIKRKEKREARRLKLSGSARGGGLDRERIKSL